MPTDQEKQEQKKDEIKAKAGAMTPEQIAQMKKDFEADLKDQKQKADEHQEIVRKSSVEKRESKADSKASPATTKNSDEEEAVDIESNNKESDGKVREVGPSFVQRVRTSISVKYLDAKTAV